jgi:phosphatidylserine/phosphatidylglycerophosphate/cardiolipin synthase-like enzyme
MADTAVDPLGTTRPETTYIDEQNRIAYGELQWLLEYGLKDDEMHYPTTGNAMEVLIGGEMGFAKIATDIAKAEDSIDIVCWGFDPAMELVRFGTVWPRNGMDSVYGELLKNKAAAGVKVRILAWHSYVGGIIQNNLVGYSGVLPQQTSSESIAMGTAMGGGNAFGAWVATQTYKPSVREQRNDYCVKWWRDALSGKIKNLEVRFRAGQPDQVLKSLADEKDSPSNDGLGSENYLLNGHATHHQKPILIDYSYKEGIQAVGYIMGLNSVTDYWDTAAHPFDDPQREVDWDGSTDDFAKAAVKAGKPISRKPLQDYAARLEGNVLASVNKNFYTAWDKATKKSPPISTGDLAATRKAKPAKLGKKAAPLRLQVLRTQPEEGYTEAKDRSGSGGKTYAFDKTIKQGYFHASAVARHYLYIENQYFFYEEWARHLKANRQAFMSMAQAGKARKEDMGVLHTIVVIPAPENDAMIPRTHDTLKSLGQGGAIPKQDAQAQSDINLYNQRYSDYQQRLSAWEAAGRQAGGMYGFAGATTEGGASNIYRTPKPMPPALPSSAVVQSSMGVQAPTTNDKGELQLPNPYKNKAPIESIGMKVLVCKMVTKEVGKPNYRDIYIHSKLMMADDHYMTLGSANMNMRSMAGDSEINVATADNTATRKVRGDVWRMQTGGFQNAGGGDGSAKAIQDAFDDWKTLSGDNATAISRGKPLIGFIIPFKDDRQVSGTRRG